MHQQQPGWGPQGHGAPQGYGPPPGYGPPGHAPPPKKKSNALVIGLAIFGALVLIGVVNNIRRNAAGSTPTSADQGLPGPTSAAPLTPKLPPEPTPPVADKAGEVPDLEAKLAAVKAYAGLWSAPRADLNLFLTGVSQTLEDGTLRTPPGAKEPISAELKRKGLDDAVIKLFLIHMRVGRYPADFTEKLKQHVEATRGEPHHGVWSEHKPGQPPHDYAALAAWLNSTDEAYLREHLAARTGGPFGWPESRDKPPLRPWLVNERAALERLALLGPLSSTEDARLAALVDEAKRPRQPRLDEEFKLGEFTYKVKQVTTYTAIGSGYAEKRASEGARFVVVEFTIRNDSNATATVLTDDFRIVDAQGREFRPSSEGNTALAMSGKKDLFLSELHPGLTKTMATAFEMPDAAAKGVFTLVIPEKGLLGAGSVRITLR